MRRMRDKNLVSLVNVGLLVSLMAYMRVVMPIVPYDGDDWYFIGSMRVPLPLAGAFNPIKVLPEVLEPLCGYFAAYAIYPLTGDYIDAISLSCCLVIALFLLGTAFALYLFLRRRLRVARGPALVAELFFALGLVLLYKRDVDGYFAAFSSVDLNCYFNYIIPGLMACTLVLIDTSYEDYYGHFKGEGAMYKGVILLWFYFTVFSSIQLSMLVAVCCFLRLVSHCVSGGFKSLKSRGEVPFYGVGIMVWVISLAIELSGERADMLSAHGGFFAASPLEVAGMLHKLLACVNRWFAAVCVAGMVAAVVVALGGARRPRDKQALHLFANSFVALLLCTLYLLLLYMKTGGTYASRPDGMWGVVAPSLLLSSGCIGYLIDRVRWARVASVPLLAIFILLASSLNYQYSYSVPSARICREVDRHIVEQVLSADERGLDAVEVHVPKWESRSNWPHPYNMGIWLQNTLFAHGLIETRLKVTIVPDEELNKTFFAERSSQAFYDLEG